MSLSEFTQTNFGFKHQQFNELLDQETTNLAQSLERYNKQHNTADDDEKKEMLNIIEKKKQQINRYRIQINELYKNIIRKFNQTNQYLDKMEDMMWITEKMIKPEGTSLQTMARDAYNRDTRFKRAMGHELKPVPHHVQSVIDDTVGSSGGRRKSHKKTCKRNKKK